MPKIAVYFSGRIQGYHDCEKELLQLKKDYSPVFFISLNAEAEEAKSPYFTRFKDLLSITDDCIHIEKTILPDYLKEENFASSQEFIGLDTSNNRIFLKDVFLSKKQKYWKFVASSLYTPYSQHFHNNRAYRLVEAYQKKHGQFDLVLKFRTDLQFSGHLDLRIPLSNTLYIPEGGDFEGGINDQIAYGDPEVMKSYSHLIDWIKHLISNNVMYHPETLLGVYLREICRLEIARYPFECRATKNRFL